MDQVTRMGGTEAAELDTLFFRYGDGKKSKILTLAVSCGPTPRPESRRLRAC
jgi:hypothetical protein